MSIVLLFGFFMSVFLFFLLLAKKTKTIADKYLIPLFLVYALTIGGAYTEIYNLENDFPMPNLSNVSWLFLFLHGPALWFYVQSLINKSFKLKWWHTIHFLPFFGFLIIHWFDFFSLPASQKIYLVQNEVFRNFPLFKFSVAAIGISTLGYNIWALILLRRHLRTIKNEFSNIEAIDLKWLKALVIASLLIFSVNVLLFNLNNIFRFASYYQLSGVAYVFATIYVIYLGFFGIRQGRVFAENAANPPSIEEPLSPIAQSSDKQHIAITESTDIAAILEQLTQVMEHEQPYLNPEITLAKLSKMLNVKPDVLSNVLNNHLQQNFFDYINKHRIAEFKIQCLKPENKQLSILGIALDSGFNSKAAFYRAFNKFEGMSPSDYISKY